MYKLLLFIMLVPFIYCEDFTSDAAKTARKKYEDSLAKAKQRYIKNLKHAKSLAIKKQQIYEAVRIDKAIKRLKAGVSEKRIIPDGVYDIEFSNGARRRYIINNNRAEFKPGKTIGKIQMEQRNIVIIFDNKQREVWTVTKAGYKVLHFTYPDRKRIYAFATIAK